jgi:membrane-associated phospholipid phosphatase
MKILKLTKYLLLTGLALVLFVQSCKDYRVEPSRLRTSEFDSKVFLKWNDLFLELDRYAKGYRPGPAPRALGYLGLAAYQSVVAGMPEYNSMENYLPGLDVPEADPEDDYHWPACVNESYAFLMTRFFFHMESEYPALFQKIEQLRQELHNEFVSETKPEILERSEAFGQSVAAAVYEWEKLDVPGHNAFLDPQPASYTPPQGPGLWQPTFPDFGPAMFPYWGNVRMFAMKTADKLAEPPIPYSEDSTSLFYLQASEVYNTVNFIHNYNPLDQTQVALAYDLKWIAIFWSDDILNYTFSPPPRLVAITNQVVEKEKLDLAAAAELYAKMGLALSDAGVATWYSKYVYNVERPVSYIRRIVTKYHSEAASWKTILDNPYTGDLGMTPAFPAYPSGHSAFGGAGGKILSSFFEFNSDHPGTYTFTDVCHQNRLDFPDNTNTSRTFTSFKDMANEDAYSRIPLGVHFRMDCDEGLRLGELAAQRVLELPWKK